MSLTKEEFKKRWDSNEDGGGITFEDIADCAIDWGLCLNPKMHTIHGIMDMVLDAAGCDQGCDLNFYEKHN
jgi:hypothetical protein